MPLYEYQCRQCGHRFERIQKFSDPHVTECPKCGAQVEQLISAPAVQFKGSGWYVTDYARKASSGGKSESGKPETGSKADSSSTPPGTKDSGTDKK